MAHQPTTLKGPRGSYALLAEKPKLAVVFVHGFDGNARTTWVNFQLLVDQLSERFPIWQDCDLFFYAYRSYEQVIPQAQELLVFLSDVANGAERLLPDPFALPSSLALIDRPKRGTPYDHLVLVGHSTGAVIIREAILQRVGALASSGQLRGNAVPGALESEGNPSEKFDSLLLNASLRLFAPAHLGAICAGLLAILLHIPGLGRMLNLRLRLSPLFHNIMPGSPVLERIQEETERLNIQFPHVRALRAACLFGRSEAVVTVGAYKHDNLDPTLEHHDHISVCKPSYSYAYPLEFVLDGVLTKAASR